MTEQRRKGRINFIGNTKTKQNFDNMYSDRTQYYEIVIDE